MQDRKLTRRRFAGGCGVVLTALVAGCGDPDDIEDDEMEPADP